MEIVFRRALKCPVSIYKVLEANNLIWPKAENAQMIQTAQMCDIFMHLHIAHVTSNGPTFMLSIFKSILSLF